MVLLFQDAPTEELSEDVYADQIPSCDAEHCVDTVQSSGRVPMAIAAMVVVQQRSSPDGEGSHPRRVLTVCRLTETGTIQALQVHEQVEFNQI